MSTMYEKPDSLDCLMAALKRPHTTKGLVACRPFPAKGTGVAVHGGFAVAKHAAALVALEVVLDTALSPDDMEDYGPGWKVWVASEQANSQWAKLKFEVEGVKGEFILVPRSYVLMASDGGGVVEKELP